MAEGTVFEIRNLFFNTPARLKFLKSKDTEAGHVADQVTRLALSRPDVRFSCVCDGRTLFRALNGDMKDRVAALLGRSLAADLYPVDRQVDGLSLSGLAGKPECSRSAGSHLYTFVNGRFVRDRVFQHAVLQAYRRFLEKGRYPVAVLFLAVPAGDVDVNVHPTKHEVRFRDQSSVHDFIVSSLEDMLQSTPWIRKPSVAAVAPETARLSPGETLVASVRESLGRYQPRPAPEKIQETLFRPEPRPREIADVSAETTTGPGDGFFCSLTVLGRYLDEYLLCQDGDDLLIIDQHAAHERVAFERLKRQFSAGAVESQGLLFPEVVELSHSEAALVSEHAAVFRQLGFDLEDFGGQSRVRAAYSRKR